MKTQKLKLLLLEDNEIDATLIQRVLQRADMNFEPTIVSDRVSFLEAIQQHTFDVILADNYLPQFNATSALEILRAHNVNTPLLLVSGTVVEESAIGMMKAGVADYILKDRLQRLPSAVTAAVEKYRLEAKQKKNLEDLVKNEAYLRTIFDNTDTGYALLDTSLNIVSFNHQIYIFSVQQMAMPLEVGKPAIDFFVPERKADVAAMFADAQKGGKCDYEVAYPQHDGSVKWFFVTCHPVMDNGAVIGIIMSETDITKRKLMELQEKTITDDLILRNNVLEQFAYIISHNLRSPVSTIMGISELLKDDDLPADEKAFFMNGIAESVKKLDTIIIDLSSVIQFKNTEHKTKEHVYFQDIVNDVVAGINNIIDNPCIEVTTDFKEVPEMVTLKSYMHSIFYNLISNSVKYRRSAIPLVISITSRRVNGNIALIFKDNGLGIDMARKGEEIFGLYKRFHVDAAEGKGMGLFMVKTQVETLGGRISVASEVNKGAEFTIQFDH